MVLLFLIKLIKVIETNIPLVFFSKLMLNTYWANFQGKSKGEIIAFEIVINTIEAQKK